MTTATLQAEQVKEAPAAEATAAAKPTATRKRATKKAAPSKTTKKAATKKASAKKAPAKKSTKKAAPAKKEAAKKTSTPRAKKEGLRKPQERILLALAKYGELTRSEIAAKAPVDNAFCTELVGSRKPEVREKNDVKHFPSLISLDLVRATDHENSEGKMVVGFSLTAKGKKEAEKLSKSTATAKPTKKPAKKATPRRKK